MLKIPFGGSYEVIWNHAFFSSCVVKGAWIPKGGGHHHPNIYGDSFHLFICGGGQTYGCMNVLKDRGMG